MSSDLYAKITDSIIADLERGVMPWLKPWKDGVGGGSGIDAAMPCNAVSGRSYSGVNAIILWATAESRGYQSGRWLTYKQAKESGGHVRQGEKSTLIVYMRPMSKKVKDSDSGEEPSKRWTLMRGYLVFNIAQCDNLPDKLTIGKPLAPIEALDSQFADFIAKAPARIQHGGDRAFYSTQFDFVQMPMRQAFKDSANYKATLLHELTHWTGHQSRLAREFGKRFGTEAYAAEELVAEIGAAFLCAHLGTVGELRHAAYVANWLRVLKGDSRAIFTAASKASQAADYLRAFSESTKSDDSGDSESELSQAA